MYILFNQNIDTEEILNFLISNGFNKSIWSYDEKEAKGICTCIIKTKDTDIQEYIFLGGSMLNPDPRIGWIHCRKECTTVEDFKNGIKEQLKIWQN